MMDNQQHQEKLVTKFLEEIEELRIQGDLSYMDAIVDYCEINEVEIETIARFVKDVPKLKYNIEQEAEDLNYFEKTARLPL